MNYKKLTLIILLLAYCVYYVSSPIDWHFIDGVDLIIHEAGHVIFWPFGEFMHILGGSLNQVLIPLIFAGYFVWRKQYFSASLLGYWVGINLINVSVYAGDALKMQLPLLTGNSEDHDWNQLLFRLGWLRHTTTVSHVIFYFGIMAIVLAFLFGLYFSYRTDS